jgi:hypothetical protein
MKDKLDADVINKILNLDPHALVTDWLERLQTHEERSGRLFPQKISRQSALGENRFTTKIYEARVSDIYGRLTRIKKLLAKDREISALSLFKDLMPGLASRYEDAINKYELPSERFSNLTPGQFNIVVNRKGRKTSSSKRNAENKYELPSERFSNLTPGQFKISLDSKGCKISSSKRNEKEMAKMSRPLTLDEKTEMVSPRDAISFLNETTNLDRIQQLIKKGRLTLFKKMERTQQEEVINGNDAKLSALNFSQFNVGASNTLLQALGLIDLRNLELINVKSSQDYLIAIIKHSHAMKRLLIEKYNNADRWLLDYLGKNLSQLEVLWIKDQPQLTDHDYVVTRYISPFQNLKELTLDSLSNLLTLDISIPNIEKLVLIDLPKLTQIFKNQRGVVLTKLKTLKLKNLAILDSLDFKAEGLEVLEIEGAPKLSADRLLSFIEGTQRLTSIIVDRASEAIKLLVASLYQTGRYIKQDEKKAERYFSQLPDRKKYKDYLQGRFVAPLDTLLLKINMRIGAYKRIVLSGLGLTGRDVEELAAALAYENNGIESIDLTDNKLSANVHSLLQESIDMKHNAQASIKLSLGKYIYNEALITSLLEDTYWGRQDKIEGIVSTRPFLLRIKGNCTDLSGRQFNGITAFQYAWWACDWYMWRMMIKYMDKAEVLRQVDEIESNRLSWVAQHGVEFDISGLTHAYDNYINNYYSMSYQQRKEAWCKGVGGQQRLLPPHVISEYCRADRDMENPNFRDDARVPTVAEDVGWHINRDIQDRPALKADIRKSGFAAVLMYQHGLGSGWALARGDGLRFFVADMANWKCGPQGMDMEWTVIKLSRRGAGCDSVIGCDLVTMVVLDKKSSSLCLSTRRAQKGELLHVLRHEAGIEHGQDLSL